MVSLRRSFQSPHAGTGRGVRLTLPGGATRALDADPGAGEFDRAAAPAVLAVAGFGVFLLAARLFGAARPGDLVRAWRARRRVGA